MIFVFYPLGSNGNENERGGVGVGGLLVEDESYGDQKGFVCQVLLLLPLPHSALDLKKNQNLTP